MNKYEKERVVGRGAYGLGLYFVNLLIKWCYADRL